MNSPLKSVHHKIIGQTRASKVARPRPLVQKDCPSCRFAMAAKGQVTWRLKPSPPFFLLRCLPFLCTRCAWNPPTPQQREIDRLIKRHATLISLREAVEMLLRDLGGFADDLQVLRTRFNQLIARLDLRVKALVEASPDRQQKFTRLCPITGVGPVVGTALVNTLERVPVKSADAFVAFTGLDPPPDDSGQHRGKRRLFKTRTGRTAPAALPGGDVGSKDEDMATTLRAQPGKGPIQHGDARHPRAADRSYGLVDLDLQNGIRSCAAHESLDVNHRIVGASVSSAWGRIGTVDNQAILRIQDALAAETFVMLHESSSTL